MKKPSFKRMRAFLLWAVLAVYLVFCVVVPFLFVILPILHLL